MALILGSLPRLVGLAIVMPALGHASRRFYPTGRPASYFAKPHSVLFPLPAKNE